MSILVIGSTGTIGTHVVESLARRGADVTALIHKNKGKFPHNVKTVKGDTTDADSMRAALTGINTVFLLNPVVADELNRALLVLNVTQEFGIKRLVYFSMFHSDVFLDCPHANAKYATELMIERFGLSTTILRPNYFFQNDGKPVVELGVYPEPIGSVGVTMVDARDIAEIAAISLIRRDQSPDALPTERIEIHGPDVVTSQSAVALWSEVLGRNIAYLGDDLRAAEKANLKLGLPSAMAYDVVGMFRGFQRDGMVGSPVEVKKVAALLGRPQRTYREYAEEAAKGF